MEKDIIKKLGMESREEVVQFLKKLWTGQEASCSKCGTTLDYLHKKAKKSECDWKCPQCGEIYRTIDILNKLND